MGTSSLIGYEENGKYHVSYGGCDGYIEHNGEILLESYNSLDKVKDLIYRGNFACLYHDIDDINFKKYNNFDKSILDSFDEVLEYYKNYYVDYLYMFKNGKWMIWKDFNVRDGGYAKNPKFVPLEDMYLRYAKENIDYTVEIKFESLKLLINNIDKLNKKEKNSLKDMYDEVSEAYKLLKEIDEKIII